METLMAFISLFITPVISLYIYYKANSESSKFIYFTRYCIYVSANFICGKLVVGMIGFLFGYSVSISGLIYSLISLIFALIIPIVDKCIELKVEDINEKVKYKKNKELEDVEEDENLGEDKINETQEE